MNATSGAAIPIRQAAELLGKPEIALIMAHAVKQGGALPPKGLREKALRRYNARAYAFHKAEQILDKPGAVERLLGEVVEEQTAIIGSLQALATALRPAGQPEDPSPSM